MTSSRSWQAALRQLRVPAVVIVCAMPLLVACSGVAGRVMLPAKSAARAPATFSAPVRATPRKQVIAALAGYTDALSRAEQSRSDTLARELLQPHLAAGRIRGMVEAIRAIWARGDDFYGEDVLHILTVRIDGMRAFVHDCDNTSGMGLTSESTGQVVPGSAGVQHANLVTRLDLVARHWVVESQVPEDVPCAP
jgi:hypothetical protein